MSSKLRYCPYCKADLRGIPMSEESKKDHDPPYYWNRQLLIFDHVKNKTVAFECPECTRRWCVDCGAVDNNHQPGCEVAR